MRMSFSEAVANGVDANYPRLIDKFELKIKLGTLSPRPQNDSDFEANDTFCGFLGNVGRISRDAGIDSGDLNHCPYLSESNLSALGGWIFNTKAVHARRTRELYRYNYDVSNGSRASTYPVPLFAGDMTIYKYTGKVELDFSFNLTRFQNYNSVLFPESLQDGERRPLFGVTDQQRDRVSRLRGEIEDEYSMDGGDNYLPPINAPAIFHNSLRHVRRYVRGVENAVAQELQRAGMNLPDIEDAPILRRPPRENEKYKLNKCEVYFEFSSSAPAQTLKELAPILALYSRQGVSVREYEELTEGGEANGSPYEEVIEGGWIRSYVIRLPYNNSIAIYAKTNRRIRVEVRYNNLGSALPLQDGKTCSDINELYGKFEVLNNDARAKVDHLLSFIRGRGVRVTETSVSVPQLIMDVHKHCNYDSELANVILGNLAEHRVLRSMQGVAGGEITRAISNMRNRVPYVIESCNEASGDGFYVPTADYSWAVSKLGEEEFWQQCVDVPEPDSQR